MKGGPRSLDRRIRPAWALPKPRKRHRAAGPPSYPFWLELLVCVVTVRWVL
jgi:hypothetical protein